MAAAAGRSPGKPAPGLVPALYTDYLPPQLLRHERDFFAYAVEALPLNAATVVTATFAVQNDSDFLAVCLTGTARDTADPTTVFASPAITLQITDSGSGRNLFNRAVDWNNAIGPATLPFYLPYPKYIGRASTVTFTFTNLAAAGGQDYNVRLNVSGFKIFDWEIGT